MKLTTAAALALICTVYGLIHIGLAVISGEPVYLVLAAAGLIVAAAGAAVAVRAR